jgi:hypothetical protein
MKFEVARRDLDAALQVVLPAVSSAGTDISSHLALRAHPTEAGKIEILAYTGRLMAGASFVATITGEPQSFTVEGWRLKKWLDAVTEDTVLVFDYKKSQGISDTTVTLLNDDEKRQFFPSLDPSHFPYWDRTLADAKVTATLPGDRLKDALFRSKLFTAEDEAKNQGMCVSEVRDGVLTSTNKSTLCMITVPALKASTIRVHNKDAGALIAFLGLAKTDLVEVLEHERSFFFRRPDGSYIGETRFHESFPAIAQPKNQGHYIWEFPAEQAKHAMNGLLAGAAKLDDRLTLRQSGGRVVFGMDASGGKQATWPVTLTTSEVVEFEGQKPLPLPESIQITVRNLRRLIEATDGDKIRLLCCPYNKSGYFRYTLTTFEDSGKQNGDECLVMIVWSR